MADNGKTNKGGSALAAAGGALAGSLIAGLIQSKPAQVADESAKLDYIEQLLEAMGTTQEAILAAIQGLSIQGGGILASVLTPWVAQDPVIAFQHPVLAVGTYYLDNMVDARKAKRLTFRAESSLDQAVSLQMVGNFNDDAKRATNIGAAQICAANGYASLGIGLGGAWQSYMGLAMTVAVAPTSGLLIIYYVIQE